MNQSIVPLEHRGEALHATFAHLDRAGSSYDALTKITCQLSTRLRIFPLRISTKTGPVIPTSFIPTTVWCEETRGRGFGGPRYETVSTNHSLSRNQILKCLIIVPAAMTTLSEGSVMMNPVPLPSTAASIIEEVKVTKRPLGVSHVPSYPLPMTS